MNLNINVNLNICKDQNAENEKVPDVVAKSAKEKSTQPENGAQHPLLNINGTKSSVNFYKEKIGRRRLSNYSKPKAKNDIYEYGNL